MAESFMARRRAQMEAERKRHNDRVLAETKKANQPKTTTSSSNPDRDDLAARVERLNRSAERICALIEELRRAHPILDEENRSV